MNNNILILIPAYKPSDALVELTKTLSERGYAVLCVDDGSGSEFDGIFDRTSEYALVIRYQTNRGKGGALKHGMDYIISSPECASVTTVVTADADGQHKPDDIEKTAHASLKYGGFVLGVRRFTGKVPLRSRFGNSMTKLVFAAASGKKLTDTQTGLRAMKKSDLPFHLSIPGNRYEYEMNVLFAVVKSGTPITEVPIETVYENNNESSHFHPIRDSARIYKSIFSSRKMIKNLNLPKGNGK